MSAVVFLLVCFLSCSVSEELQEHLIIADPGDEVTLPCKAPNNTIITSVLWSRSDLDPDKYIYFKLDGRLETADQDPSYVNRVQLKDDEMKNGDLSLILKNVNKNDEGTYECRYGGMSGGVHQSGLISTVYLNVEDPHKQWITVQFGDAVTLPCEAPNVPIAVVEWGRSDLKRYIFFKRDGHVETADQDPSYVNRVQLKDDEMKNGDLSLILKNVTSKDEGTYECHYVGMSEGVRQRKLSSIVYLKVNDPQRIQEITVQPGDDVILPCRAPNTIDITAVEWSRPDLDPDRYVYWKTDGHLNTADQDPSYVNRVQLKDDEMKNGELSLILKNVTNNDEGTYECHYVEKRRRGGRRKRSDRIKLSHIIHLNAKGPTGGDAMDGKLISRYPTVIIPVTVIVAFLAVVGLVIFKTQTESAD